MRDWMKLARAPGSWPFHCASNAAPFSGGPNSPPARLAPWQAAHWATNSPCPCTADPGSAALTAAVDRAASPTEAANAAAVWIRVTRMDPP